MIFLLLQVVDIERKTLLQGRQHWKSWVQGLRSRDVGSIFFLLDYWILPLADSLSMGKAGHCPMKMKGLYHLIRDTTRRSSSATLLLMIDKGRLLRVALSFLFDSFFVDRFKRRKWSFRLAESGQLFSLLTPSPVCQRLSFFSLRTSPFPFKVLSRQVRDPKFSS